MHSGGERLDMFGTRRSASSVSGATTGRAATVVAGPLPSHIDSVASVLLFNTTHNPSVTISYSERCTNQLNNNSCLLISDLSRHVVIETHLLQHFFNTMQCNLLTECIQRSISKNDSTSKHLGPIAELKNFVAHYP